MRARYNTTRQMSRRFNAELDAICTGSALEIRQNQTNPPWPRSTEDHDHTRNGRSQPEERIPLEIE